MKTHTTNYKDTFIEVAEDCPVTEGEVPPEKGTARTVANIQFDMIIKHPYQYTSDDVLFQVFAEKNGVPKSEQKKAREVFFSKGQPCLRARRLPNDMAGACIMMRRAGLPCMPPAHRSTASWHRTKSLPWSGP